MNLPVVLERRLADLRWAIRSLRRTPTSSAIAILSLALGIGANTAIFSLINALLLRTLPVPSPQELRFVASNPAEPRVSWNYPDYLAFRDGTGVPLAAASGVRPIGLQTSEAAAEAAELAQSQFVTGNYFAVMGVQPEVGRLFNAADDTQMGAAPYAVLGYDYWRARFAGDPGVVGRTIRVSGYPLTVIGVVRRGFKGTDPTTLPGLYVPITMYSEVSREPAGVWNTRHYWWIRVIGRVPPGANVAALETRLTNIGRAQEEAERREDPRMRQRGRDLTIALMPGARGYTYSRNNLEMPLLVLMAMVGAVLLIACANVANVLLARGAGRGRELAIRMAMGAGRGRIVVAVADREPGDGAGRGRRRRAPGLDRRRRAPRALRAADRREPGRDRRVSRSRRARVHDAHLSHHGGRRRPRAGPPGLAVVARPRAQDRHGWRRGVVTRAGCAGSWSSARWRCRCCS